MVLRRPRVRLLGGLGGLRRRRPAAEREHAVPGAGASGHDGRARPPPRPARRQLWRAWRRWPRPTSGRRAGHDSCKPRTPAACGGSVADEPARPGCIRWSAGQVGMGGRGVPTGAATRATAGPQTQPLLQPTPATAARSHDTAAAGPDQTAAGRASRLSQRQRARRAPCVTRPPWRHVTTLLAGVCAVRGGVGASRIAAADQATGPPRVVRRMP